MEWNAKTLSEIVNATGIFYGNPLHLLRILILAEYMPKNGGQLYANQIPSVLTSPELYEYLNRYGIPAVNFNTVQETSSQIVVFHRLFPDVATFQAYFSIVYPYRLKNPYVIDLLRGNPLSLYTCLYRLLDSANNYSGEELIKGTHHIHNVYFPNMQMWASLGVSDIDTFVECWKSVAYYESIEEPKAIPSTLQTAIAAYSAHKEPLPLLFTHFVHLLSLRSTLTQKNTDRELFNPWAESQKKSSLPTIERGMLREEALFNSVVVKLVSENILPTQVVDALFYEGRSDSLVEKYILFPTMQMDIGFAKNVLVVNPSPDFLMQYSTCNLTMQKHTTFVVTSSTVAQAYSLQFSKYPYEFVISSHFAANPDLPAPTMKAAFDYIVVMVRDSTLADFPHVFSHCADNARVVCFAPQTAITSKSKEQNIAELFDANQIRVDSIMDMPKELGFSGKRKKMILRAHVGPQPPSHFALFSTTCYSPNAPVDRQAKKKKSAKKLNDRVKYYTVVVPSSLSPPYAWLSKHYAIRKFYRRLGEYKYQKAVEAGAIKPYDSGRPYFFSKEIGINVNLYPQPSGGYRARAYRQYVSDQYGHAERRNHSDGQGEDDSPRRLTRTPYFEPTGKSKEKILARIDKWVLRPDITSLIARDLKSHYANHLSDLSLKSVWYCTKEELQSTYMSYDDDLAVQLFCSRKHALSNLQLRDATEDGLMEALRLTVPGSEDDPRYRRLLDLIFRVAVKRGFAKANPINPAKSTLDQEQKKSMRQLRGALTKESLEYHQIFKILKYLLEPVDEQDTPRAVKDSIWLVPLFRLCTGMPLREICALRWQDFRQIADLDAYQFHITRLVNDFNKIVPITTYQYAKKYRKVPSVTILSHTLLLRQQYLQDHYGIHAEDAPEHPIVLSKEPNAKQASKEKMWKPSTISQAKSISAQAMQKAEIPSKVIPLLDGEATFFEDLNTTRNDLYRASFIHHANWVCGLTESELCHIIGRNMPSCYSEHYVDYQNDFLQLDMIQRLDRLWYLVCQSWQETAAYSNTEVIQSNTHTIVSSPSAGQLAMVDLQIRPSFHISEEDLFIRIEGEHGVDGTISAIP